MPLDPERWRTIDPILDTALELPPDQRARFLDEACADDPTLRREIENLIASCEQAGDLFERPPLLVAREMLASSSDDWQAVLPDTVIGHWRIIREIGRGGMGAVFLAERADGAFEKHAALKIVKRGMDTDEILARFRHERQILARLQHNNIAGLIDGGVTGDGLPYFVMELASGPPIDEYADRHLLTVADRLHMFARVCDAVQYAHRNLVVHRDLKPGNILVVQGHVKLLDFGIAKLLAADGAAVGGITRAYAHRLTPQYAAPEQVAGDHTTTATDVYSLGVVLYELLTGHSPYRIPSGSLIDIQRTVCQEVPRPPSAMVVRDPERVEEIARARSARPDQLVQQLRGDLDAICLKALRKEPQGRYESVAALGEDIERHLSGLPIQARPHTRSYRAFKFVQRNRGLVSLATLLVAAVLIGLVLVVWQAREATRQGAARQQEAERAAATRDYLISVLSHFDPDRLQGRRDIPPETLIAVGFANLDSLNAQPEVQAAVMNALGQIVFNFGQRQRADSLFRRAYENLLPRGEHPDLAVSMTGIGEVWRRELRYDSARAWFAGALRIRERLLPPDDPLIAESEHALAFALYNIAASDTSTARRDSLLHEAESLYLAALRARRLPVTLRPRVLQGLGDIQMARDLPQSAIARYREALDAGTAALGPLHPENARTMWGLADAYRKAGDVAASEQYLREALEILTTVYGTSNQDVALTHYLLALQLSDEGRIDEAIFQFQRSIDVASGLEVRDHPWTAWAWVGMGEAELEAGRPAQAEPALVRALTLLGDTQNEVSIGARWLLGKAYGLQRKEAAIPLLSDSWQALRDAGDPRADSAALLLSEAWQRAGSPDSAAAWRARLDRR